jgi:type I restriction enzyme, S subunit
VTDNHWKDQSLGEICSFRYGKALPANRRTGGGYRVYGSNGEVGRHAIALTGGPTIVIGRKGSFGEVHYSPLPCWPIDTTYFVDAESTKADLRWLMYRLRGLGLTNLNRAAAIPGLNREDAYRQRLLVPPVKEQRRIAAVLDRADELRAMRRASLASIGSLKESIFLDMFGDPLENRRGWPTYALTDVSLDIQIGPFGSLLHQHEYIEGGVPLVNPMHIVDDRIVPHAGQTVSPSKVASLRRYVLKAGDIVMARRGEMGRCAVVDTASHGMICGSGSLFIRPDLRRLAVQFLHHVLTSPSMKRHLERKALGVTMANLNAGIVGALPIPVPPMDQQERFERLRAITINERERGERSQQSIEELFGSLEQRAFAGQL